MTCTSCNAEVYQNYCPNCGQAAHLHRIDGHYILHEVGHVLHFEKGIFYTIRELLVRPGQSVRRFISESRGRLVKPVIFITLTSLAYTLVAHAFHVEDHYVSQAGFGTGVTAAIFAWVQGHYGYANILLGVFIALWLQLFFRKSGYNFFEILILLCFVMGMGMLFYAVAALVEGVAHVPVMTFVSIVSFLYFAWAIGQFFGGKSAGSYVKAFLAYLLGFMTAVIVVLAIGISIDLLLKH